MTETDREGNKVERDVQHVMREFDKRNIHWTNEMKLELTKFLSRGSDFGFVEYLKKIIKDHDDEQAAAKLRGPPEDPIGKLNVIQWKQDHEKKTGAAGLKVPLLYRAGKQNIICDDAYWRKMLGKCVYRKNYPELKQEGPFRLHNGDTYYGEIIDGAIGRWGTLITLRGDIYEGEFKFYIPAVRGVFLTKDKLFYEGPVFFDPKYFSLLTLYYENLDISDLIQKNIDYREILQKNVESRLKIYKEYVLTVFDGFGREVTQHKDREHEVYGSNEWIWQRNDGTETYGIWQSSEGWNVGGSELGTIYGVQPTRITKGRRRYVIANEFTIEIDTEPGSSHGRVTKRYTDGTVSEYENQRNDGNTDGFEVLFFPSGDTYEGYWKQGYSHLFSNDHFVDGRRYLGEWYYGLRGGNGRYKRPNGVVYRGKFLKGNKHGKGEYVLLNGCTITVETEVGYITKHLSTRRHTRVSRVTQQEDGKYRLDYEDGAYYIGQINEKTQQREGYGLYVHKHKDYWYQGQWQKDIEHGTGWCQDHHQCLIRGQFKYGLANDKQATVDHATFFIWKMRTSGELKDGCFHGQGSEEKSNRSNMFSGDLSSDLYEVHHGDYLSKEFTAFVDGSFSLQSEKGPIYHDGFRHGKGVFTKPDGFTIEGEYYGGREHGQCVEHLPRNRRYEGIWIKGQKKGKIKEYEGDKLIREIDWGEQGKKKHSRMVPPPKPKADKLDIGDDELDFKKDMGRSLFFKDVSEVHPPVPQGKGDAIPDWETLSSKANSVGGPPQYRQVQIAAAHVELMKPFRGNTTHLSEGASKKGQSLDGRGSLSKRSSSVNRTQSSRSRSRNGSYDCIERSSRSEYSI